MIPSSAAAAGDTPRRRRATRGTLRLEHARATDPAHGTKPFVKWVGGKQNLAPRLAQCIPAGTPGHIELFVGGGALFFCRRSSGRIRGRVVLADANSDLINAYRVIQDPSQFVALLGFLRKLQRAHCTDHYYELRERYNTRQDRREAERAAWFVYLLRTGFNGLHRVNRRGEFNVPVGRYATTPFQTAEELARVHAALQDVRILAGDFGTLARDLPKAGRGTLVYLDPPYEPKKNQFTGYLADGFGPAEHERVADVFYDLDARGYRVLLSNSMDGLHRYDRTCASKRPADIRAVQAARSCSGKTAGRKPANEALIANFALPPNFPAVAADLRA